MNNFEKREFLKLMKEKIKRSSERKLFDYFPDKTTTPIWSNTPLIERGLYKKHLAFMQGGSTHNQRCFLAGNRVGKSEVGAFEMACHLTGEYPEWWTGKRFEHPIKAWACGDRSKTVRDTIQVKLLGELGEDQLGTGLIPKANIISTTTGRGIADSYDTVNVRHKSGGTSVLQFKTYEQGRKAFEGWAGHVIWLDEEPPVGIYQECLMRLATTDGILYITFTPLMGMSEVVQTFWESNDPSKLLIQASWDDAPHLSEDTKRILFNSLPPHQRDIRTKGIPQIGAGAVYPILFDNLVVEPFKIPDYWPRGFGLDPGWNRTAVAFVALDPDTGVYYLYSEHYQGEQTPLVHSDAILARGDIPGVIDPASRGRTQVDGKQLFAEYNKHLKHLSFANNAVEAGIFYMYELMVGGKFKVFNTCPNFKSEFIKYSRDDKGQIIKKNDHILDATRYCIFTHNRAPFMKSKMEMDNKDNNVDIILPDLPFSAF